MEIPDNSPISSPALAPSIVESKVIRLAEANISEAQIEDWISENTSVLGLGKVSLLGGNAGRRPADVLTCCWKTPITTDAMNSSSCAAAWTRATWFAQSNTGMLNEAVPCLRSLCGYRGRGHYREISQRDPALQRIRTDHRYAAHVHSGRTARVKHFETPSIDI
jgi:hypothetical protein